MEGNIETCCGIEAADGIFHRSPAQIGKINGVIVIDSEYIVTVGVGSRTSSRAAHHTDPIEWSCPVHIIYCPMYGDLAPGLTAGKKGDTTQ